SSSRRLYSAACRLKVPGYRSLADGSSKRKGGSRAPALQHSQPLVFVALFLCLARRRRGLDDRDLDGLRDRNHHRLAGHRDGTGRLTVTESDDLDQLEMLELVLFVLRCHESQVGEVILVRLDGGDNWRDATVDLRFRLDQLRLDAGGDFRGRDRLGHLCGAAGFGGVELGDDGIARLLDGAHQHHLRVLVGRLDNGDGVVVVVRNDDQGRGYSRDGQDAHRGDGDDAFADPRGQDREHYAAASSRIAVL